MKEQHRYVQAIDEQAKASLVRSAEWGIRNLPNESFGKFIRLRFAAFLCLTGHQGAEYKPAEILLSSQHPTAVEVLSVVGDQQSAASALQQAAHKLDKRQEAFVAALLDLLRKGPLTKLAEFEGQISQWYGSESPLLRLAAGAALVSIRKLSTPEFQKAIIRSVRTDKSGAAPEWLMRNPGFTSGMKFGELTHKPWKALLDAALRTNMPMAHQLMRAKTAGDNLDRFVTDSIEALVKTNTADSDALLRELITEEIKRGRSEELKGVLSKDPIRLGIRSRYWRIAKTIPEPLRIPLFDVIYGRTKREAEVVALLALAIRVEDDKDKKDLRPWIIEAFLPYLLEKQILAPTSAAALEDIELLEQAGRHLASLAITRLLGLKAFPEEWNKARSKAKSALLGRVNVGIRIATNNCTNCQTLSSGLEQLGTSVGDWFDRDSPRLDSSFDAARSISLPIRHEPSKSSFENMFRGRAASPHDMTLFMGENPWTFDYAFKQVGPWPKPQMVFEQICSTFVFLSRLWLHSVEQLETVDQNVLLDLAIGVRDKLSEIESQFAGYFAFRTLLAEAGLGTVAPILGVAVNESDLTSEDHKVFKEPGKLGRLRVFSLGIRAADKTVSSAIVMKSGESDDSN